MFGTGRSKMPPPLFTLDRAHVGPDPLVRAGYRGDLCPTGSRRALVKNLIHPSRSLLFARADQWVLLCFIRADRESLSLQGGL
jgi:hypothetical protein